MWPDVIEFRSASSAGNWREKERRKKESLVKHKSADMYRVYRAAWLLGAFGLFHFVTTVQSNEASALVEAISLADVSPRAGDDDDDDDEDDDDDDLFIPERTALPHSNM